MCPGATAHRGRKKNVDPCLPAVLGIYSWCGVVRSGAAGGARLGYGGGKVTRRRWFLTMRNGCMKNDDFGFGKTANHIRLLSGIYDDFYLPA